MDVNDHAGDAPVVNGRTFNETNDSTSGKFFQLVEMPLRKLRENLELEFLKPNPNGETEYVERTIWLPKTLLLDEKISCLSLADSVAENQRVDSAGHHENHLSEDKRKIRLAQGFGILLEPGADEMITDPDLNCSDLISLRLAPEPGSPVNVNVEDESGGVISALCSFLRTRLLCCCQSGRRRSIASSSSISDPVDRDMSSRNVIERLWITAVNGEEISKKNKALSFSL